MKRTLAAAMLVASLGLPATASAQAPVPVAPADGQVFEWADVELTGIPIVVEAPGGIEYLDAIVTRDAAVTDVADVAPLFEEAPGRYEGVALPLLFDEELDPGTYWWQTSYEGPEDPDTGEPTIIGGAVRSFVVRPPSSEPSIRVAVPAKLIAGRRRQARLRYQAGSEPAADRLHLLAVRSSCPDAPDPQAGRVLVDGAPPPAGGELEVALRPRRPGRLRLCAYVTTGGAVTARHAAATKVAASQSQMLGWRLGRSGLGPVRIGMRVAAVERVTGRKMDRVFGDHPSCVLWELAGAPRGLSLMVAFGRLARIEAFRGRWRSSRGIRIGDSARKVRRRHGNVRSRPHPYVPAGEYLITRGRRRMIFETGAAGRVTSFRGGRAREVAYIEGCA